MRALVMAAPGGAEQSAVRDVEEPVPGPGEMLIDVEYAGINFVDVMSRRGDSRYVPSWPFVPGMEVAGTVRGGDGFPAGQRVTALTPSGGLAEVAVVSAARAVPVPDAVPLPVAAAVPAALATALLLLTDAARFAAGETVLVHSASGGVGALLARLVPVFGGGRLLGTVGRPEKVALAVEAGYEAAFARGEGLVDAVRAATGGRGVDVVLDPLGTLELESDLAVLAPGGRIVLFGNASGAPQGPLPPAGRLLGANAGVIGFSLSSLAASAPERVAGAMRRCLALLADGRLELPVTELASLAEVPAVHDLMAEGRGAGKYVVHIQ
jgi:NADPH2:quinone reductase